MTRRLSSIEASLLVDLLRRGGLAGRVSIVHWQRRFVLPLWRKGLIEIWYRQHAIDDPMPARPFYGLTTKGFALANAIAAGSSASVSTAPSTSKAGASAHARLS